MATEADKKLRQQHVNWISNQPYDFDIAASWHLPMSYKAAYRANDHVAFSSCLRKYFNTLDASVFKSAYRRKRVRLPRAIVLEHTDGVGWHAHGVISTQSSNLREEQAIELITSKWHKHLGSFSRGSFSDRLVFAEPRTGPYVEYMTKELSAVDWKHSAKFDYQNSYFPI
ncbi:hypothetical protein ACFOOL_08865 [Devosia honganensis]|uniref:Inovirus Gp2 family protein n=1 Tax=Devosia honganensis TaxID=1610527 RepID=A0ABV7X227_9HYPH